MYLIDTHCHLDVEEFSDDLYAVIDRADQVDVKEFIVPAIEQSGWPHLKSLTEQYPSMHPAYGLHPMYMRSHRPEHVEQLDSWLEQTPAVAVGECGLDFYIEDYDSKAQIRLFEAQLDIARNHQLPVIIHCRKAMDQVLKSLRSFQPLTGVLHSFNGSRQQADQAMELGFKFGIGGPVTYERAKKMRSLIASLPRESLMLETDAPDQPVSGHQGQRNEPAFVVNVLKALAEVRNESLEAVACYTTENARALFRLKSL